MSMWSWGLLNHRPRRFFCLAACIQLKFLEFTILRSMQGELQCFDGASKLRAGHQLQGTCSCMIRVYMDLRSTQAATAATGQDALYLG